MVITVSVVGLTSAQYRADDEIVAIRRFISSRQPKPEDLADTQIAASQVMGILHPGDIIPLPEKPAKTQFAPFGGDNPWRCDTFMTPDEWKQVSRCIHSACASSCPVGTGMNMAALV